MITMSITEERKIPKWKIDEVAELEEKIKNSSTVMIADIQGFPTDKLHEIRKKLRGKAEIKVTKNTLFLIAAKRAGIDVSKIENYITGSNAFIFSNDNPFAISIFLSKFKLKRYPMPGDKADEEVVIPAGDTGMTAGPILSTFGKLKVQTKVQDGKVHVVKDTVIAKPGDPIPPEAAPILQKLGIMPVYVKLKLKAAYHEGLVIPVSELEINLDQYSSMVAEASRNSLALGVEIAYPVPEVLKLTIGKAHMRALALAGESGFLTPDTANAVLSRAVAKAYALVSALGGKVDLGVEVPKQQPVQQEKEEKKEEEEKKGPSDEEIAGGLSSLFG
ncbi:MULTISPECIES: 50S ribosomal protein L10 [Metallosphaera]|uniref:50S ribosomal protein L10 n=1 Tax=Metallosphaera TaxID=41980 RepID=UPI001F065C00|nr:50S ribosomal protein L10 [Metallosphaera sedula]MCH1769984.1 50S ribosomal protein L10 [Metallosphaera sedula]MCP6728182.1 50S ribosomal protein L10 [Metallosphaera sedula]